MGLATGSGRDRHQKLSYLDLVTPFLAFLPELNALERQFREGAQSYQVGPFGNCLSPREACFHNGQKGVIGVGQRLIRGLPTLMDPPKPRAVGIELTVIWLNYELNEICVDPIMQSHTSIQLLWLL